jgi:hypothetical protein
VIGGHHRQGAGQENHDEYEIEPCHVVLAQWNNSVTFRPEP